MEYNSHNKLESEVAQKQRHLTLEPKGFKSLDIIGTGPGGIFDKAILRPINASKLNFKDRYHNQTIEQQQNNLPQIKNANLQGELSPVNFQPLSINNLKDYD